VPEVGLDGGLGDEQVLGDLPVGQPVGGEAGDPPFGAGERVRAGEGGAPGPGPGREQLPPGPLGQRRGTGALRQVQGAAQRVTGVGSPSRPAQEGTQVGERERQLVPRRGGFQQAWMCLPPAPGSVVAAAGGQPRGIR
jgi:hypothetical protein